MRSKEGIHIFEIITQNGWGGYNTSINIAFLNEQLGNYSEAKEILVALMEKDPGNYITWKRLAFLEADIQNSKNNSQRDYRQFSQYYDKAKELYENIPQQTDMEMQLLDKMTNDMREGGWL